MEAFQKAGTPPQIVRAFEKTGMILIKDTPAPPEDRKEWEDAIEETKEEKTQLRSASERTKNLVTLTAVRLSDQ